MATNAPVRPRPAPAHDVAPKAPDDRNGVPSSSAVHSQGNWKETARRLWLWPVAILLSFPIGGFIVDLVVNGVDSVGTALAGGLIAGSVIGAAGWFVLRQRVSWLWIPATAVGMGLGLAAGAALVDYGIGRGDIVLMGAVTGLGCGRVAGAGARSTRDRRCVLVGACKPAPLGARLARDLLRDHGERQGAVCGLRRERRDRLRTAHLVAPRSAVAGAGTQDRGKAGRSRSVTREAGRTFRGAPRRLCTWACAVQGEGAPARNNRAPATGRPS